MSHSPDRQILISHANENPFRLTSIEGKPFAENGYFGFTFTFDDVAAFCAGLAAAFLCAASSSCLASRADCHWETSA